MVSLLYIDHDALLGSLQRRSLTMSSYDTVHDLIPHILPLPDMHLFICIFYPHYFYHVL